MPDLDHPPTEDDEREYKDWSADSTRIALVSKASYDTWEEVLVYFTHRYGRVFENCSTAKWWAARVARTKETK